MTAIATSQGDLKVDAVVLAAGALTGSLTRMLGWPIPLTAGKGYSVTIDQPRNQLRQPLYLGGAKIGLTPFEGALRFRRNDGAVRDQPPNGHGTDPVAPPPG